MANEQEDFRKFMKEREKAAAAYTQGDPLPLRQMTTMRDPATFFGPGGGAKNGAVAVAEGYVKDAAAFDKGGEGHFEILQMDASQGIGWWTGFQRANARLKGKPGAVRFNLRVTEVFRREENVWKLVHRHADSLEDAQQSKG
ncbi:MAG TPA: nuclear transport factor 2 family protein [Myxococcales bacterium]|nr:nuclear transport factor 2 family protein [Myxococcales bacterium]